MAMSIQMLYLSSTMSCRANEMGRILLPENVKGSLEFALLDITMGGQVFA